MAFTLGACSRSDEDHAREQARQSADQLKHDSREALQKAEIETRKASRELNNGLETARDKTRRAFDIDTPPDKDRPDPDKARQ
jgi:hypothetical protein